MSYVILRTAKLSKMGNIAGSAAHNFRERKTLNADPEQTHKNTTTGGAQNASEVVNQVKKRLETVPTVRKNAVLAVEYFIGMSPEFAKEGGNVEGYFDAAEKWLKEKHGDANVVAITRQYDETTPHICAYVVPIDPKGKLNARYFLGGREKLSDLQTDFADKCGKPFGLVRGIEGSKAKHTTVKQYYADIQRPVSDVTIKPEDLKPKKYKSGFWGKIGLNSHVETLEGMAQRITNLVRSTYGPAMKAAQRYEAEKAANKAREQKLVELRETATQARNLPLTVVLERLGAIPEPKDKKNWRTAAGRVTVEGSKFFNHDLGSGGGGAIDLVMQQAETDYKGAVHWLAQEFGSGAVLAENVAMLKPSIEAIAKQRPRIEPLKVHQAVPSNWGVVRGYLVEKRKLGGRLVDDLHNLGAIYADKFKNAVFVLGSGQGLSLRGTSERPFHGVRGEKVPFILSKDKKASSNEVAFVESPIDALSLRELGFNGLIVATVGNSAEIAMTKADAYRNEGLVVVAAFDKDKAGEAMAQGLGKCKRMKPNGKDWNDDLKALRMTAAERQALKIEQKSRSSRFRR